MVFWYPSSPTWCEYEYKSYIPNSRAQQKSHWNNERSRGLLSRTLTRQRARSANSVNSDKSFSQQFARPYCTPSCGPYYSPYFTPYYAPYSGRCLKCSDGHLVFYNYSRPGHSRSFSNRGVSRSSSDGVPYNFPDYSMRYNPPRSLQRRGRGQRKNDAYWSEYNQNNSEEPFDDRECLFADSKGRFNMSAKANLDTQLKCHGGSVMSSRCAKMLGLYQYLSTDFRDPGLQTISGHSTPVSGIIRDVFFRMKGTSVTMKLDFFVSDVIDDVVDIMLNSRFVRDNFKMLFEKVKSCCSMFAAWFSKKKESPEEKAERERREREQKIKANKLEQTRLQKETERLEALQRQSQSTSL